MAKKFLLSALAILALAVASVRAGEIVYLTPSLDVPFWRYLLKGIESEAQKAGYTVVAYDSTNDAARQLSNAQDAISRKVDGILISPTDSSTAPRILRMAEQAGIPVVIADIGTDSGNYVSFIISDNFEGAQQVGMEAVRLFREKGMKTPEVGQVSLSLARANGQKRAGGWRKAMEEIGAKEVDLKQMQLYTAEETFKYVQDMLTANPDIKALFVHADSPSVGAVRAIQTSRMGSRVMLFGFDGMPEFIEYLRDGKLLAVGMQQPYLMGVESGKTMIQHLKGETVAKEIMVPIILVSKANLDEVLPTITLTVFGGEL
ncbi:MAG: substrate-binding domain-containing protein [Planctomycetota bacterium]|jgi:ABC-type sugar transport system substrate-binding protein|nr:substrate-binding domain-containing protein [Planctomycetota bacterium]